MYLSLIYGSYLKDKKETKASIIHSFFRLIRYKNSNYIKDPENKKSIMGYCYFINEAIVF